MIARLAFSGEFYLIYLHTAELFPRCMRGTAFGIWSIVALIVTTITDLEPSKRDDYTLILGLVVMFIAAALSITLEETLGKKWKR